MISNIDELQICQRDQFKRSDMSDARHIERSLTFYTVRTIQKWLGRTHCSFVVRTLI